MNGKRSDALGLVAGTLTTIAFVPQVFSIWSMRPTPATMISFPMYVIFCTGIACWLAYGVVIKSKPVIFTNIATLALSISILAYKCIYG